MKCSFRTRRILSLNGNIGHLDILDSSTFVPKVVTTVSWKEPLDSAEAQKILRQLADQLEKHIV